LRKQGQVLALHPLISFNAVPFWIATWYLEFFGHLRSSRSSHGFRGHDLFEFDLSAEPVEVASYDGERQFLAAAPVGDGSIAGLEVAVELCSIPSLGVAGVGEPQIVLLDPEERHLVEPFAPAQNVVERSLPLAFGHDPSRSGQRANVAG
jgi:hypothetical protein